MIQHVVPASLHPDMFTNHMNPDEFSFCLLCFSGNAILVETIMSMNEFTYPPGTGKKFFSNLCIKECFGVISSAFPQCPLVEAVQYHPRLALPM